MRNPVPESVWLLKPLLLTLLMGTLFLHTKGQQIKWGNSYINVTKKTVGGTVENGDILEIRFNIWFPADYNLKRIYYARYLDNIPTNTVLADDSLRLITNEGLLYKRWTLASDGDPGTYLAGPPSGEYNIRINLGRDATAPVNNSSSNVTGAGTIYTGNVSGSLQKDKPQVGSGVLITTSFRVRVTGNIGDTITLGAGQIRFKSSNNTGVSDMSRAATQYQILISSNDPICPNAVGRNFAAEYGGTFDSGAVQNRTSVLTYPTPYQHRSLSPSLSINDGWYGIVNNLSPWASTYQNAEKKNFCTTTTSGSPPPPASCANRMFGGHWDIIGDHTGSSTPAGNVPAAAGTMGGYMLVVNADYATHEAYRQSISGLCPNTSYEFSLWVKNVCTNCGLDSSGAATYKPGVYPNLTFAIDDLDRYSSGQVDTIGWMKKGFLFRTGPTQTSITISVRNNASGGGGNDWAIDDIALVTCNPNLNLVPSGNAQVCYGSQVDISSTVNSFFNNYTYYRFERSTDNGASWSVAGSGTGTPASVSGGYQYNAQLVPSFLANEAQHMNQYRFVVASTADNLANSDCSFFATATIIVMVNNCSVVLSTRDSIERLRRVVTRTGKHAEIRKLVNPFGSSISFELIVTQDAPATFTVIDNLGRVVRQTKSRVLKGYNQVILDKLNGLSNGMYFLRVETNGEVLNKAVIKGT